MEPWLMEQIGRAECEQQEQVLAALWSELGGFYRGSGRLEESEYAFNQAVHIAGKREETKSLSFGVLLVNLAGTLRLEKRFEEALELFDRAGLIMKKESLKEDAGYQLASLYNNKSLVYQDMGLLEKAKEALLEALDLIAGKPEWEEELAITYTNLALLEGKRGNRREEEKALNQAVRLYERVNRINNPHYASALSALGGNLYEQGEYKKALDAYQQAAQIMYRLFGANREYDIIINNSKIIEQQLEREEKRR